MSGWTSSIWTVPQLSVAPHKAPCPESTWTQEHFRQIDYITLHWTVPTPYNFPLCGKITAIVLGLYCGIRFI